MNDDWTTPPYMRPYLKENVPMSQMYSHADLVGYIRVCRTQGMTADDILDAMIGNVNHATAPMEDAAQAAPRVRKPRTPKPATAERHEREADAATKFKAKQPRCPGRFSGTVRKTFPEITKDELLDGYRQYQSSEKFVAALTDGSYRRGATPAAGTVPAAQVGGEAA